MSGDNGCGILVPMSKATVSAVALGLALAAMLVSGSLTHALISHEHGGYHHVGESIVWQSLHGSMRHEDKKVLPTYSVLIVIAAVMLIPRANPARTPPPVVQDMIGLRRGILPHRKFG